MRRPVSQRATMLRSGTPSLRPETSRSASARAYCDLPSRSRARPTPTTGPAENGHGLRLVEILSARWSYYSDAAGMVTWFELTEPPRE
jgi:hypothetical protein